MYLYCKQGINKSESNFLEFVVHILSIIRFPSLRADEIKLWL